MRPGKLLCTLYSDAHSWFFARSGNLKIWGAEARFIRSRTFIRSRLVGVVRRGGAAARVTRAAALPRVFCVGAGFEPDAFRLYCELFLGGYSSAPPSEAQRTCCLLCVCLYFTLFAAHDRAVGSRSRHRASHETYTLPS